MPWDDNSPNITNLSFLNPTPAGKEGFVKVENGHLYAGDKRLKLLGVNLTFNATTPDHETADKIAARLARFGINAVRFHLMDVSAPKGILNADMRTLNPDQLDRFDYFFSALKRRGIYSDINLQVLRRYPGLLLSEDGRPSTKGIDQFQPDLVEQQKDYARTLLQHRNPYTGNRYVDDPAVALVEINNENGLIQSWQSGRLDRMNSAYKRTLTTAWQSWIEKRYPSKRAWGNAWAQQWSIERDLLADSTSTGRWQLELNNGAAGLLEDKSGNGATARITRPGNQEWDAQLNWSRIKVEANAQYRVSLKLRTSAPTKVMVAIVQNHQPWNILWQQWVTTSDDWHTVDAQFQVLRDEPSARLTISGLGLAEQVITIAESHLFSLAPKEIQRSRLAATETYKTLMLPTRANFGALSPKGKSDWISYLWETEQAYWLDMRRYLRDSVGVKIPMIGTQTAYSPAPLQSAFDVVDAHGYWDHPRFPKVFGSDDWNMQNRPLAGMADAGPIADLALWRIMGKPFVVTEYDHPFPNSYEAEGLPLLAAYASLQDWDGFFQFCYGFNGGDWLDARVVGFFESHANPVKMAGLLSAALLFRREDVSASTNVLSTRQPFDPSASAWIPIIVSMERMPNANDKDISRIQPLREAVGFNSLPAPTPLAMPVKSDTGELTWGQPASAVTIDTPRSKGIIGRTGTSVQLGGWSFRLDNTPNGRGLLLAQVLEGDDFQTAQKILITAIGVIRNSGQRGHFEGMLASIASGNAPTQLSITTGSISLPLPSARVQAWSLDARGERSRPIAVKGTQRAEIEFGPDDKTLWYEINIASSTN